MPSRRKRKRQRRKMGKAEATAKPLDPWGGWGAGVQMTRGDWALVRQAANQDWPVADDMRQTLVDALLPSLQGSARLSLAVAWAAIAMEGANQRALSVSRLLG